MDVHIDIATDRSPTAIETYIVVNGNLHLLDASAARQVAAELLNAADELDSMAGVTVIGDVTAIGDAAV